VQSVTEYAQPLAGTVVLLVEDQPADAELIAIRLDGATERPGSDPIRLMQAWSAAEACERLRTEQVDVVVLDLTLPDARWLEALHQVRAIAPGVPVIVLTGTTDEALGLEALRAGAQDYVVKPPPDQATLRRILRHACERQHLIEQRDAAMRAAELSARRWWLLSEVGRLLAGSVISGTALAEVIGLVVPDAAARLVVVFAAQDDSMHLVEAGDADARNAPVLREHAHQLLKLLRADNGALLSALDIEHTVDDEQQRRQMLEQIALMLEMPDACITPLRVGGRATGILALSPALRRGERTDDLEFARTLADRISIALERAQLFEQTRRAIVARDRAFGIVSHDLRNPLGTIQICANALLDPDPPPLEGIRQMAGMIQRSAAWMQRIVTDLLDRAGLDSGQLTLARESVVVEEVAREVRAMFAPVAAEAGIRLNVECAPALPQVDADPNRLLQILGNLISNAIKFTSAGGSVSVIARIADSREHEATRISQEQCAVCFVVRDSGSGIAEDDLPHIFDWYWRTHRKLGSGAGLGLGIAKGLVEAHRGELFVESHPGRGSTFRFTIPAIIDSD